MSILVLSLFLFATSLYISGTNLTAYDVVQKYKLPRGILPEGVIDYDLNPKTGFFKVYLNNTCRFPIEVYKVKYQPIVSGFIKNGRVSRLKGVSVKVLYFWLSIGEVTSDGQELELSVGAASEEFSAHQFARSPQCGCGFYCRELTLSSS
ncbi:unnamed protein product [Brassica oleracea var. botrytis]|uniref:uncharacterized protein LOC106294015 n=1 Tax=Brassica oleracea var. oleracea TaxID=109376 RepID=UPI0006A6BB43|nr:PREDICTED: uncharacterized protein LOC106294015 [Brassica oleracea var. oleracea]